MIEIWKTQNGGDIENTLYWRYGKHRIMETWKTHYDGDMENTE